MARKIFSQTGKVLFLKAFHFFLFSLSFIVVAAGFAGSAHAGDPANFRNHGFDGQGRYFAFEEFGRQDGSGFVYSNIYVIDLEKDEWVDGTPIRVLLKEERQPELAARVEAFSQAGPILQKYGINVSGVLLAASPLNELSSKTKLSFAPVVNPLLRSKLPSYDLTLKTFNAQSRITCPDGTKNAKGFSLTLKREDRAAEVAHKDVKVPGSRGCPEDYHLMAVFAPGPYSSKRFGAALVGVFSYGFEGPDLRYIAVPVRF